MSEESEGAAAPAKQRVRSLAARRAARRERAVREARIVGMLNRGVAVAEIADREGVSLKRMRNCVRELLARRAPQPPAEFLAAQIGRLNEALLLSYSHMHDERLGPNYKAIDRVVRIVRELDRYHGFRPERAGDAARPLPPPAPRALPAPTARLTAGDSEMAPEALENP